MLDHDLLQPLQAQLLAIRAEDLREAVGQKDQYVARLDAGFAALERAILEDP